MFSLRKASIALLFIAALLGIVPSASAQTSETWTNVYDLRNRLVEVRHGSDILLRLEYDAQSRFVKKIGAEGVRQYVYDGSNLLEELDGDGNEIAKYDWGTGPYGREQLIRYRQTNAPGQPSFYPTFDGNGSVTGLTDSNGNSAVGYHLDAWGNFRFPGEINASANRFAYTAYRFMPEAGLYFAVSRFYDPKIGRFLTRDTYLGDIADVPTLHRYSYSRNNPTGYIDPDGHESYRQWIGLDKPTASVEVEFLKNFGYNAWDALSFGALGRQDSLVEKSEAGLITENQYLAGTTINGAGTLAVAAATVYGGGGAGRLVGGSLLRSGAASGAAGGLISSSGNAALDVATGSRDLSEITAGEILVPTILGGITGGLLGAATEGASSFTRPSTPLPRSPTIEGTVVEGRSGMEVVRSTPLKGLEPVEPPPASSRSVWSEKPTTRGRIIEDRVAATDYEDWHRVGSDRNGKFPLVDFQKDQSLISLKSVDTNGKAWLATMRDHIRDLGTRGATVNGKPATMILDLRVQPGGVPAAESLVAFGKERGVTVITKEMH